VKERHREVAVSTVQPEASAVDRGYLCSFGDVGDCYVNIGSVSGYCFLLGLYNQAQQKY
jgi:hypothetical protein